MGYLIEHMMHVYLLVLLGVMSLWIGSELKAEGWMWIALFMFLNAIFWGYYV